MSTVVVVKKNGRVCIAADTLVSWGSTKQSAEYLADKSKIIQVGDSYVGITGASTHRHVIESYFSRQRAFFARERRGRSSRPGANSTRSSRPITF